MKQHLLAAALAAPLFCAAATKPAAIPESEWKEISAHVAHGSGVYSGLAKTRPDFSADGSFMGNGNIYAVLAANDLERQVFTFDHSDMWTDGGGTKKDTIRVIPFGGLEIAREASEGDKPAGKKTAPASVFRQEHNVLDATVTASSPAGFKTRSWVAANENVVLTELWTEGTEPVPMSVGVWAKADTPDLPATAGIADGGTLWAKRSTFSDKKTRWTTRVAIASRILGAKPKFTSDKPGKATASFLLEPGKIVSIYSFVSGGKNATAPESAAQKGAASLNESRVAELRREHAAWWKNFWAESAILTHDSRLEKSYYGSLYLYACTNRAGFTPVGQYPFCLTDNAAWQGDYHLNQEYMGQNCGLLACNKTAFSDGTFCRPLFDFMPYGRWLAAREKNRKGEPYRGILFSVGAGPWGIDTEKNRRWHQVADASFTGAIVAWQYAYYQDKDWLRKEGYTYLRELGEFWESALILENGRYVTYGASHEGEFGKNSVMDLGTARFVLRNLLEFSRELGVDADKRATWQNLLDKLSDYPTRVIDGKTVFSSDADPKHKCICRVELAHIYPGEQIDLASPKHEIEVAHNTIARLKAPHYEYPVCAVAGTRLGYPIGKIVDNLKAGLFDPHYGYLNNGLRENGTCGGNHYNGAVMEFLQSSMLQTDAHGMRIFPNWYRDRPAKFLRLRAKGAFVVSAEQDATGTVRTVSITSEKGRDCPVVNPWPAKSVAVTRNGKSAGTVSGERFTLKTAPGETLGLAAVN